MASVDERPSFEQLMKRLEGVVQQLEAGDLSLEAAIEAYQQGVTLAKEGHDRLADAERRIEEVTRQGETRELDADRILQDRD